MRRPVFFSVHGGSTSRELVFRYNLLASARELLLCVGKRSYFKSVLESLGEPNKRVSSGVWVAVVAQWPHSRDRWSAFLRSLISPGDGIRFEFSDLDKEEKSGVWLIDGVSHKINTFLLPRTSLIELLLRGADFGRCSLGVVLFCVVLSKVQTHDQLLGQALALLHLAQQATSSSIFEGLIRQKSNLFDLASQTFLCPHANSRFRRTMSVDESILDLFFLGVFQFLSHARNLGQADVRRCFSSCLSSFLWWRDVFARFDSFSMFIIASLRRLTTARAKAYALWYASVETVWTFWSSPVRLFSL